MDARPLYERYRPQTFDEVVGQEDVISKLKRIRVQSGLNGKAYWLSGKSGQGKTTIARLIAQEVASPWAIEEYKDPSEIVPELANIGKSLQQRPFGKGQCFILNEAHGCSDALVRKLLGLTETIPPWITWVFTTTSAGQESLFGGCIDAKPLLSRCHPMKLNQQGVAKPFAERLRTIAQAEGLDGKPLADYLKLVNSEEIKGNMRAALQAIESGAMLNPV